MTASQVPLVYLDNAATSFPKAPGVAEAMQRYVSEVAGSAGRGQHSFAVAAEQLLWEVRRDLAALLGTREPTRWVFMFNATDALNAALKGYLRPGDHVLVSPLEHNAVARCLRYLEQAWGVEITRLPYVPGQGVSPADIARHRRRNTRLVVATHASNVSGEILPVRELAAAAHEQELPLLVDAAQTAGALPLEVEAWQLDMVAITGHKSLLGPPGTGALYVRPGLEVTPLRHGGTGSYSEQDRQPQQWPDAMESGTMNGPGLAGWRVALAWLRQQGIGQLRRHEEEIIAHLLSGLAEIPGVEIYGPRTAATRVGLVSINLGTQDPAVVAYQLEQRGILTRAGLHCAPWAHECLGTLQRGTLRLSVGPFTTHEEIDLALHALRQVARGAVPG
jgi:cysteine desulfurase family protein